MMMMLELFNCNKIIRSMNFSQGCLQCRHKRHCLSFKILKLLFKESLKHFDVVDLQQLRVVETLQS